MTNRNLSRRGFIQAVGLALSSLLIPKWLRNKRSVKSYDGHVIDMRMTEGVKYKTQEDWDRHVAENLTSVECDFTIEPTIRVESFDEPFIASGFLQKVDENWTFRPSDELPEPVGKYVFLPFDMEQL